MRSEFFISKTFHISLNFIRSIYSSAAHRSAIGRYSSASSDLVPAPFFSSMVEAVDDFDVGDLDGEAGIDGALEMLLLGSGSSREWERDDRDLGRSDASVGLLLSEAPNRTRDRVEVGAGGGSSVAVVGSSVAGSSAAGRRVTPLKRGALAALLGGGQPEGSDSPKKMSVVASISKLSDVLQSAKNTKWVFFIFVWRFDHHHIFFRLDDVGCSQ